MPKGARSGASKSAGGVAGNSGGTPKPFLEKMVGEVLETRLHPPVVLSDDKDEGVGSADFGSQSLHGRRCCAPGILLVHSIEDGKSDAFRVDKLNGLTSFAKAFHDEIGESDTQTICTV